MVFENNKTSFRKKNIIYENDRDYMERIQLYILKISYIIKDNQERTMVLLDGGHYGSVLFKRYRAISF